MGPLILTIPTFFPLPSKLETAEAAPILKIITAKKNVPKPHQIQLMLVFGLFIYFLTQSVNF